MTPCAIVPSHNHWRALGAVVLGIVIFKEPATAARMFFAALLLVGIIGLKATAH